MEQRFVFFKKQTKNIDKTLARLIKKNTEKTQNQK